MPTQISKQPDESWLYDLKFYDEEGNTDFRDGEVVDHVVSVDITAKGVVAEENPLVKADVMHDGDKTVQVRLAGGTNGEKYNVKCLVVTSLGNTAECDGTLKIKEVS